MKRGRQKWQLFAITFSLVLFGFFHPLFAFGLDDENLPQADIAAGESSSDSINENGQTTESVESQSDASASVQNLNVWDVNLNNEHNTTKVDIAVPSAQLLSDSALADSVVIDATMSYKGNVVRSLTFSFSLSDLIENQTVDFNDFGKFTVTVSFQKDGETVKSLDAITVGVTADSYNISPVSATLPVTFYSLNLWGDNSIRASGPCIMLMERPASYDWAHLPQPSDSSYGVYGLPYIDKNMISYQPSDFSAASLLFRDRISIMADYVHDLMSLDSSSKINLYCVDYFIGMIQPIIYANKIPADQYSIVVLSDGSFSYQKFGQVFSGSDNKTIENGLVQKWNSAKASAYNTGSANKEMLDWDSSNKYLWAAVDSEPNAQWWVARKALIKSDKDKDAFGSDVRNNNKVVQLNIGNLLKQNIQSSDENTQEFKDLYNFNDSFFKTAQDQGKKVMLFLGSVVYGEQNFADYARFNMLYYGDEYQYYYKGHPGTPTDSYPEKQKQLDDLGIEDVNSSIAAELILFFNPDIFLSGYDSSTYASVPDGMAEGMFNMTKSFGLSKPQYSKMDYWSSKISDSSSNSIRNLCNMSHDVYLVEFSDAVKRDKGYDIAIWDATDSTITYYVLQSDGSYQKQGVQQGSATKSNVKSGKYIIQSALAENKVVDIKSGSHKNGANAQLYKYNASNAQKWSVDVDNDGYATIKNIGSGLCLDVTGANASNGANVQQYEPNGSLAQKWIVTSLSDSQYKITSALSSDLALDVSGGAIINGTNLQIWKSNDSNAQKYYFTQYAPDVSVKGQASISDGYYLIKSSLDLNKALDLADWHTDNGANYQIWDSTSKDNQLFRIYKDKTGFYHIENVFSEKSLDATDGSVISGTYVQQWASDSSNRNQQWKIIKQKDGGYTFQNVSNGLMLDIKYGTSSNGSAIDTYRANGSGAQSWLLFKQPSPYESLSKWAKNQNKNIADGQYIIKSSLNGSSVLDVANGSHNDRANVQLYQCNFSNAQTWSISHDRDGFLVIKNIGSGKVLDVQSARKASGTNVQQYTANGSSAQKWIAVKTGNHGYELVSALSADLCLDVSGGNSSNGSNIQLYSRNGSGAQQFNLYKLS